MKRLKRRWRTFGVVVWAAATATFAWAVAAHADRGFAFTPRWSALFAAWALLTITLFLDWLVRRQGDESVERAAEIAKQRADAARAYAAQVARAAHRKHRSPLGKDVVAAGRVAVSAAAEYASALVRARRAGLKSLVIGADGRASTSKIQAVMWTYGILYTLLYMVVLGRTVFGTAETRGVGGFGDAFADFLNAGFRPEYVALLGLPIAGAVAAKGITSGKVVSQDLLKPPPTAEPGVGRGLAEAVSNDAGQTDMVDFQYFAFNLIALLYFFISFATTSALDPSKGLPTIPPTLLALSGVSTTAYLVKKQLETGAAPVITSVTPMRMVLGTDQHLLVAGDGFLAEGKPVNTAFNQVLLDGRPLPTADWSRTSVTAVLPDLTDRVALEELGWRETLPTRPAALTVRDDRGTSSPLVEVDIVLPGGVVEEPPPVEEPPAEVAEQPPDEAVEEPPAAEEAPAVDEGASEPVAANEEEAPTQNLAEEPTVVIAQRTGEPA
ncbi:MAG TPA: IPT/TIG domain-containing protein [Micromonosporaceae bacterium]